MFSMSLSWKENKMERRDQDLAFMLQYENVAWYEDGKVRILDRRIYPTKVEFVTCYTLRKWLRQLQIW